MAGLLDLIFGSSVTPVPFVPDADPVFPDAAGSAAAARVRRAVRRPVGIEPDLPQPGAAPWGGMGLGLLGGLAAVPSTPAGGFDALDAGSVPTDEAAAADDARGAAAARVAGAVRRPSRWPDQAPIPAIDAVAGLLSPGGAAPPAMGAQSFDTAGFEGGFTLPPSTNDPASAEPQVVVDGVPLPRPKPQSPTESSSQRREPAPAAPLSMAPGGAGGLGGMLGGLFKPENASLLLALGAGLSGAPSFGTGMRRAAANAVPVSALMERRRQTETTQRATFDALLARGVPPQEAMAAIRDPNIMKAVVSKYFETEKPITVGNTLVRVNPDGTVKELGTFGDGKNPVVQEFTEASGKVKRQWNPTTKKWDAIPGFEQPVPDRQNIPSGYRLKDPNDPNSDLVAWKGGPAEKVDAQVAARLGLAQSFRDQLPEIRRKVAAGEATGPWDAFVAQLGYGSPGELRRQIASGAEALLRNMTGAGMNMQEASDYASRYKLQPHDTAATMLSKLDQLARELIYTDEAVKKGRGGTIRIVNGRLVETEAPITGGKTKSGLTWSVE